MLIVYVNYPNKKFTVHLNSACSDIEKMGKTSQRKVRLNISSLSDELSKFKNKTYTFGSDQSSNDMYLEIDCGDPEFEMAILKHVQKLIGKHYTPLAKVAILTHC